MSEIPEYDELSDNSGEVPSPPTYEVNLSIAETLEAMEEEDAKYRRRERFWRNGGPFIAIAPLVSAGVLMATPIEKHMNLTRKLDVDAAALVSTALLSLIPGYQISENRRKGQELAKAALPASFIIGRTAQPWIAKRLDEKAADDAGRELRRSTRGW